MKKTLKKLSITAAMLLFCMGLASCGQASQTNQDGNPGAEGTKFVILHTNDMHGYMQAADGCLGIGAVAQLKKDYEEQGYDVLLMDAGDYLQGSSFL